MDGAIGRLHFEFEALSICHQCRRTTSVSATMRTTNTQWIQALLVRSDTAHTQRKNQRQFPTSTHHHLPIPNPSNNFLTQSSLTHPCYSMFTMHAPACPTKNTQTPRHVNKLDSITMQLWVQDATRRTLQSVQHVAITLDTLREEALQV